MSQLIHRKSKTNKPDPILSPQPFECGPNGELPSELEKSNQIQMKLYEEKARTVKFTEGQVLVKALLTTRGKEVLEFIANNNANYRTIHNKGEKEIEAYWQHLITKYPAFTCKFLNNSITEHDLASFKGL